MGNTISRTAEEKSKKYECSLKNKKSQSNIPESLRLETFSLKKKKKITLSYYYDELQSWKKTGLMPQSMPAECLVNANGILFIKPEQLSPGQCGSVG